MHSVVARGSFHNVFVLHIHKSYFPICLFGRQQLSISTQFLQNKGLMPAAEHAQHLVFDGLLQCDFGFASQVPSQQLVLDVFWKNSSCFSFLLPYHGRERKMRIQLAMDEVKKDRCDTKEDKTIEKQFWLRIAITGYGRIFLDFVLSIEMQIPQIKQRVFLPGLSEQCGILMLTKVIRKSPWCQVFRYFVVPSGQLLLGV